MKEILKSIDDIRFESYDEIYLFKNYIKRKYINKTNDVKIVYKWYFYYQLCLIKPYYKDSIWLWLNDKLEIDEVDKRYNEFKKKQDHIKNLYKVEKSYNQPKFDKN